MKAPPGHWTDRFCFRSGNRTTHLLLGFRRIRWNHKSNLFSLQRLLQKHGGDLEKYETSRVTHIIAEHLSTAKAKIYRNQRRPVPVCYPKWITDSVDAGRLLPHATYLIQEVKDENVGVKTVKSFFGAGSVTKPDAQLVCEQVVSITLANSPESRSFATHSSAIADHYGNEEDSSVFQVDHVKQNSHQEASTFVKHDESVVRRTTAKKLAPTIGADQIQTFEQASLEYESNPTNEELEKLIAGDHGDDSRVPCLVEPMVDGIYDFGVGKIVKFAAENLNSDASRQNHHNKVEGNPPLAKLESTMVTNDKYINGRLRTVGTDPNFLETFFNSSRLSFIGSYKQRIQKLDSKLGQGIAKRSKDDSRFIFHVDMDSFFASVVLRNYPEYRDKPVVISHHGKRGDVDERHGNISKNSTSECATCNYAARKFGITKGMYLGRAKELCPDLIVLYYDFNGYEEVSEQVAEILHRQAIAYNGAVEQVSCDESYVELFLSAPNTGTVFDLAKRIAEDIREEIYSETQCTATIGVGPNKLLAKIATDNVKPNGSLVVREHSQLLKNLDLRDLNGVGYRMEQKLSSEGLVSVSDVWDLGSRAETVLCHILGIGLGKRVLQFCRGQDERPVKPAERKTIGAECNYGVRFDGPYGVDYMIEGLAKEVEHRMESVGVRGCRVTLKVKQRKAGAKPPPKFLGHGSCHNLSKSAETPSNSPTRDWQVLARIVSLVFDELSIPSEDIRGMGIVVSKLVFDDKQVEDGSKQLGLVRWLEGSPQQSGDVVPLPSSEELAMKPTPRKLSVSFAPKTSLRSFDDYEIIEIDEELSSHAARADTGSNDDSPIESEMSNINIERGGSSSSSPVVSWDEDGMPSGLSKVSLRNPPVGQFIDEEVDSNRIDSECFSNNIVETTSASDRDDCNDIVLPPLSQIHMSQVEFLPKALRISIEEKIQVARMNETGDVTDRGKPALVIGATSSSLDDLTNSRLRQVSVKRMLKLAAVKTRVETLSDRLGESVSLTQLECLPLELQLQVANNDNLEVGVRSPDRDRSTKATKNKRSASNLTGNFLMDDEVGKQTDDNNVIVIEDGDKDDVSTNVDNHSPPADCWTIGCEQEKSLSGDVKDNIGRSFFLENVAPLHEFLDDHPDASDESVHQVIAFLSLCLSEQRPHDTVLLLRCIKHRSDPPWCRVAYPVMLHAVNERFFQLHQAYLDTDGLGLQLDEPHQTRTFFTLNPNHHKSLTIENVLT